MMKVLHVILGIVGVAVGLAIVLWLLGHAYPEPPEITVAGSGTARGVPDMSEIRGTISSGDKTAEKAQATNIADTKKLINEILKAGIEEKDLTSAKISLRPEYDYKGGSRTLRGYTASTTLSVKIRDFDKIPAILDLMTSHGVGNIWGPSLTFSEEKLKELRSQAREQAVRDGRDKAAQLASLSGRSLGGLLAVNEGAWQLTQPWMYPYGITAGMAYSLEESDAPYIQPGENEVRVTVEARYRLR